MISSDKQPSLPAKDLLLGAIKQFTFLSILSGHLTLLWYYPLWSMSFTGCELSLIVLPMSAFVTRMVKPGKWPWILAIILGLYIPANLPFLNVKLLNLPISARLISSAFGLLLATSMTFRPLANGYEWTLGILMFSLIKYAFVGNIPVWPVVNEQYSSLLVALLIFAAYNSENYTADSYISDTEFDFLGSLKIGSWMYLIDNFISEAISIQAWSLRDHYEQNTLIYSEFVTIGSFALSLLFSLRENKPNIRTILAGLVCSLSFYFIQMRWIKLASGIGMKCLLLSQLVHDASRLTGQSSKTIAAGLSVYIFTSILHMASTAYAFMPMGWVMRERVFMVFIPAILVAFLPHKYSTGSPRMSRNTKRVLVKVFSVFIGASFCVRTFKLYLKPTAKFNVPNTSNNPPEISQMVIRDFGGLPVLRMGVWAVHFGIDHNLYSSEHRIARVINTMDLDVIGLVESDLMRSVMGQRDLGTLIATSLPTRYYVDYGPSPRKHTWGCTLLSRFPINNSTHYLLPSPKGEIACAILANIQVSSEVSVNVLIAHNGQEEDKLDRQLQTDYLAELVKQHNQLPLIYAGYLVAKPHSDQYHRLFKPTPGKPHNRHYHFGSLYDIDPDIQDRWCLYIGHNQRFIKPIGFARVHHGGITDTELQVGSFAVMPAGKHPPDFDQKWDLVTRQVRATDNDTAKYYRRWHFDEPLSICPAGASTVCEHYYHLKRHYF